MTEPADIDRELQASPMRRIWRTLLPAMLHFCRITTLLALLLIAVAAIMLRRDELTWGIPIGVLGVTLAVVAGTLTQSLLIPKIAANLVWHQKALRATREEHAALVDRMSGLREDRDALQQQLLAIEAGEGSSRPGSVPAEWTPGGHDRHSDDPTRGPEAALGSSGPGRSGGSDKAPAIVDVAAGLVAATSVEEIYQVVSGALQESEPSRTVLVGRDGPGDGGFVVIRDARGDVVGGEGWTRTPLMALYPPQLSDLILLGLGLERPLWAEDLSSVDSGLSPELSGALVSLWETGLCRALVMIPIRGGLGGPTLAGAAIALFRNVHRFESAERQVHELLSGVLGGSLVRTRSSADLQAQAVRQQQYSSISDRLRHSTDVASILETSLRELGRALGASGGEIRVDMAAALDAVGRSSDGTTHRHQADDVRRADGGEQ